jgi:cytochrome P450
MLETLYGYTATAKGRDPLVDLINRFMAAFSDAASPGTWLVDVIPWLRHVPEWLPGAGFQRTAREYRKLWDQVTGVPFQFTEERIKSGDVAKPSFISGLLEQNPAPEEMDYIRDSATGLYAGGADTTVAQLGFFFLAMTVFPEVQKKAREEIDRVTGGTRLPAFQDRDQLPYVEAVYKEALRWNPIAPLGLPHATDEEDVCRGYRIPKGSLITPAIAWFSKDPEVYPEPDRFRPERFLGTNPEPNPTAFVFGYGRRVCPGRHLAESNMFLVIAQSLAAFDISKAVDKSGNIIEPRIGYMPGVVGHPEPFKCRITPRSEKHAQWVKDIEIEQPWAEGDVELLKNMRQEV